MKIKVYVIDVDLSPRARKIAKRVAAGIVISLLALAGGAIAYASVPHTWTNGDVLQATDLNGNFTALDQRIGVTEAQIATLNASNASYVLAEGSATSSNGQFADVVFDAESADQLSEFDGTVFTAAATGVYQCSWSLATANLAWAAGDTFNSFLEKNNLRTVGSAWEGWWTKVPYAMTTFLSGSSSVAVKLSAGETLRVIVNIVRAGGATTLDAARMDNYFSVVRVQ